MNNNKVLLIDDDPIANMINTALLEIENFEAFSYTKPQQALENLKSVTTASEFVPAVILLDINMPEMDGWEFLEEYQKTPFAREGGCKLFMLTSSIDPGDEKKSRTYAVVNGFLSKPLNVEKLRTLL